MPRSGRTARTARTFVTEDPAPIAGYLALGRAMSDLTEELVEAATTELETAADRAWSS